jgi:hypothetical protein
MRGGTVPGELGIVSAIDTKAEKLAGLPVCG